MGDELLRMLFVIVGIILIVTMTLIMLKVTGLLGPTKAEDTARASLERLAWAVREILEDDTVYSQTVVPQLSIPDGYIIVGFDTEWDGLRTVTDHQFDEYVIKPSEPPEDCSGSACLCLYENTEGPDFGDYSWNLGGYKQDNFLIDCVRLRGDIVFLGPTDEFDQDVKNYGQLRNPIVQPLFAETPLADRRYEYLLLYGVTHHAGTVGRDEWRATNMYVEKTAVQIADGQERTLVYIAKWNDDSLRRKARIGMIAPGNEPCPDSSTVFQCNGVRRDQVVTAEIIPVGLGTAPPSGTREERFYQCAYDESDGACSFDEIPPCIPPGGVQATNVRLYTLCRCGDLAYYDGVCYGNELYLTEQGG
ncbi:hypothetical protein JXB02_03915 [Candidatus Woesearchaeota archaeon]|nr:hypothetical protein [Candidatus Woesearchaeota archaeon]